MEVFGVKVQQKPKSGENLVEIVTTMQRRISTASLIRP